VPQALQNHVHLAPKQQNKQRSDAVPLSLRLANKKFNVNSNALVDVWHWKSKNEICERRKKSWQD
jgi:hypothetical protein